MNRIITTFLMLIVAFPSLALAGGGALKSSRIYHHNGYGYFLECWNDSDVTGYKRSKFYMLNDDPTGAHRSVMDYIFLSIIFPDRGTPGAVNGGEEFLIDRQTNDPTGNTQKKTTYYFPGVITLPTGTLTLMINDSMGGPKGQFKVKGEFTPKGSGQVVPAIFNCAWAF
jgi:hypothetical protein